MLEYRYKKLLDHYYQYISKHKIWIFVSIIKVSTVCFVLLLLSDRFFYSCDINNEIPEVPKIKFVYRNEGKNVNFLKVSLQIDIRQTECLIINVYANLGLSQVRFKLEHCNCERTIIQAQNDGTRTPKRNKERRGNHE